MNAQEKLNQFEIATLGGGCFWCLEAVFQQLKGVVKIESGYSGGSLPDPSYKLVCSGMTGHAEVVQITFDPALVSFKEILQVFFTIHDPTTLNRQGADIGSQYRSIILYHSLQQREIAQQVISEISSVQVWEKPIVTEVTPFEKFYSAEAYHQNYYLDNSAQPYCQIVIAPKVTKFRKQFVEKLQV